MDKVEGLCLTILVLLPVLAGSLFVISCFEESYVETRREYYDLYYAKCPFGVLWVETRGGGFFLFIAWRSSLEESYVVKYWENNLLKTKIFDATKTSIIVDGTFRLEYYQENKWGKITRTLHDEKKEWIIHIPKLPEINKTISMEWTYVEG